MHCMTLSIGPGRRTSFTITCTILRRLTRTSTDRVRPSVEPLCGLAGVWCMLHSACVTQCLYRCARGILCAVAGDAYSIYARHGTAVSSHTHASERTHGCAGRSSSWMRAGSALCCAQVAGVSHPDDLVDKQVGMRHNGCPHPIRRGFLSATAPVLWSSRPSRRVCRAH